MGSKLTERTILIAVDGSKQAEHTVDWYFAFLRDLKDKVVLVYVPEMPIHTLNFSYNSQIDGAEVAKALSIEKNKTEEIRQKYSALVAGYKVEADFKTVVGKPGEAIVRAADEVGATMVIMGARGLGMVRRTIMGSVSDYVVHHAKCPVLVCRKGHGA